MKDKLKEAEEVAKELLKLMEQFEKLVIRIISLVGWILILIQYSVNNKIKKRSRLLERVLA